MDNPGKDNSIPDENDQKKQVTKKPAIKQVHEDEKFSPGEPDAYDAEQFATD